MLTDEQFEQLNELAGEPSDTLIGDDTYENVNCKLLQATVAEIREWRSGQRRSIKKILNQSSEGSDAKMQCKDIGDDEIIEAVRGFYAGGKTPDESLAHKYPQKLILAKMQKMVDKGILECGVSLRTAWIDKTNPVIKMEQPNADDPQS